MAERVVGLRAELVAAGLLSCAGLFPLSSSALALGDLAIHSNLGQPLRVTIPVRAGSGEQIDGACFSLARPEQKDDSFAYLTQARLALEESGGRFQLKISSANAINEPFIKLLLQANCGQGRLSREFTVLLDPVEQAPAQLPAVKQTVPVAQQPPTAQTGLNWEVRQGESLRTIASGFYPGQPSMQRSMMRAIKAANPELRAASYDSLLQEERVIRIPDPGSVAPTQEKAATLPRKKRKIEPVSTPALESIGKATASESEFRLKLSTNDLDLSALGKLPEEQRLRLREKQLLLDADDQVANSLSMKNRIMQLEAQLGELQAQLNKTNSRLALSEQMAAPAEKKIDTPRPEVANNRLGGLENVSLRGMAGVTLILALVASVWWRWRRRRVEAQLESEMEQEFSATNMTHFSPAQVQPLAREKFVSPSATTKHEEDFFDSATSIFAPEAESVTFTEAESVLDEADLYLAYGWANRAIELLQEYHEKHPDDVQLWKKLFETYHSQSMKKEFGQLALRCRSSMDDSGLWLFVQKLGRQLDAGNPLYLSNPEQQTETAAEVPNDARQSPHEAPPHEAPLEFVLDEGSKADQTEHAEPGKAEEKREQDPLFPDLFAKTKKEPANNEEAGKGK